MFFQEGLLGGFIEFARYFEVMIKLEFLEGFDELFGVVDIALIAEVIQSFLGPGFFADRIHIAQKNVYISS